MVWMFVSFIFSYPCFPIPLSLPTYSQSHVCFHIFDPWWQRGSNIPYSCRFISYFSFVSIYGYNSLSCIIKQRKALTRYCFILFTFYLHQDKIAPLDHDERLPFFVDWSCRKRIFLHPLSLLHILGKKRYIHSSELL